MNSIRAGGVTVSHFYSNRNEPLRPADPSAAGLPQITAGAYADARMIRKKLRVKL
jgi:hypothetical protein